MKFCEYTERKNMAILRWEKRIIREALEKWEWNVSRVAKDLGIDRSNLLRKIRQLGFKRPL